MTQMKLLTVSEAARQTGFKPRTIARWCREGKLDATKVGRVWRIEQGKLNFYFEYTRVS